jgi:hypothetical protein
MRRSVLEQKEEKVIFSIENLSCGYYDFTDNGLIFCPEVEWRTNKGTAKFAKSAVIISFHPTGYIRTIEIPFRIIEAIYISSQPTTLTLTLWEAPRIFEVEKPSDVSLSDILSDFSFDHRMKPVVKSRVTELEGGTGKEGGIGNHHEIMGQTLVYRLSVSQTSFHQNILQLRRRSVLPTFSYNFPAQKSMDRQRLADGLRSFQTAVQESAAILPFSLLYQVEALVKNSYILPWTGKSLLLRFNKSSTLGQGLNDKTDCKVRWPLYE